MDTLCLLLAGLLVLGKAAYRWGANSIDGINSPECKGRQEWPGFH
jgi:hypothetical protein